MTITTIMALLICVGAGIGAVVGFFKGFTRTSAWGGTVLLTLLIERAFLSKTANGSMSDSSKGLVIICVTLAVMLVVLLIFRLSKLYLNRAMEKRRELSYYKKHDEREENTERILSAIDSGDKKAYRKNARHKYKASAGAWGITNRAAGAVFTAINVVVALGIIFSIIIVTVDFARYDKLSDVFVSVFENETWKNIGAKWAFDLVIISLMCTCIMVGFKHGLLSSLGAIVVLGLLVGSGFLSHHLAFHVEAFRTVAEDFAANASFLDSMANATSAVGITAVNLAQCIIMLGVFVVLLVPVILIGIFLPKLIDRFREEKVVSVVDGVLGAAVLFAVVFVIIMLVSAILYTLHDLAFMEILNTYADTTNGYNYCLAAIYQFNPFNSLEFIKNLNWHDYLAPKAE